MKQYLINHDAVVESVLRGVLAVSRHPLERVGEHHGVIYRGGDRRQAKLVVGGGSGHEPLFLGAVGPGMADGAAAGEVFAAPNPGLIQRVCEAFGDGTDVVFLYGNYSGDALNFSFAAEELRQKGGRVEEVRIHDDIASAPPGALTDRRGTAGDLFVIKCAGAAADQGHPFDEIVRVAEKANAATRSLGVALSPVHTVETGEPMFDLPAGQMEVGMGLHGEMGIERSNFETAETLVPGMVQRLLADFQASGVDTSRVAVMVNGLGGTTVMELLAVAGHVRAALDKHGKSSRFAAAGNFATSLDMAGFSVTLAALDDELEALLTQPCDSPAFTVTPGKSPATAV